MAHRNDRRGISTPENGGPPHIKPTVPGFENISAQAREGVLAEIRREEKLEASGDKKITRPVSPPLKPAKTKRTRRTRKGK